MVFGKVWSMIAGTETQDPSSPSPPPTEETTPAIKKPRIGAKRYGPRGPYQRLLNGREWADYLEKCYEYHLKAEGRPTILAFCDKHCPSRRRTFYQVWNRSGLQEFLADRLPLQDVRVQARLQQFIETHDNSKYHKKKRSKKTSNRNATPAGAPEQVPAPTAATAADLGTEAAAAAAAAATIANWMRRNAAAIVDATPVGIAVPVQTEHGDMLSAIKINAEDFILYEDNRLLKITKDDLLDDYRILGGGGGGGGGGGAAMHHPALTGGTAHVLNSPLLQQGTSVTYGDARYLQGNNGAFTY